MIKKGKRRSKYDRDYITFGKNQVLIIFFLVAFSSLWVVAAIADVRLIINAKVNGEPVRFALDTGCSNSILFRPTVARLKLKVTEPPQDFVPEAGEVRVGITEECILTMLNTESRGQFYVCDTPSYLPLDVDGFIAWATLRNNIFFIQCDKKICHISKDLPSYVKTWSRFKIRSDSRVLIFEVPNIGGKPATIMIDTGAEAGVYLSLRAWNEWLLENSEMPFTLEAFYTPADGLIVRSTYWAKDLSLGSFVIHDVLISSFLPSEARIQSDYEAVLGLCALTRLKLVIDGKNNFIYVEPQENPQTIYQYNRLGAVFVPDDPESDNLVAHVAKGSPAFLGGIRDGDVLTKIGDLDIIPWRTKPGILPLSRFFECPAGTELNLSLRRGGRPYQTTVILKDILNQSNEKD